MGVSSERENHVSRVFAIIPAAGRSQRMGAPKILLDLNGQSMLTTVVESLLGSMVTGVLVVTNSDLMNRLPPLSNRVKFALNHDLSTDMIGSIRCGIAAWREQIELHENDGFLICPADHPGITPADFNRCITAFHEDPTRIVIACREAKQGHPMIFPASNVPFVESTACDHGLNMLPRTHADRVRLVECDSPGITRDIDTLDDYHAAM